MRICLGLVETVRGKTILSSLFPCGCWLAGIVRAGLYDMTCFSFRLYVIMHEEILPFDCSLHCMSLGMFCAALLIYLYICDETFVQILF